MRKNLGMLMVLLSLILWASGCSGAGARPAVEQTGWILESLADESVQVKSYGSVMPSFTLADGKVSGNLGVNYLTGTYDLSGNDISFSQLTTTKKADVPEAMEQERQFLAAFEAAATVEVEDRTMTISDSAGTVVMRLSAAMEG